MPLRCDSRDAVGADVALKLPPLVGAAGAFPDPARLPLASVVVVAGGTGDRVVLGERGVPKRALFALWKVARRLAAVDAALGAGVGATLAAEADRDGSEALRAGIVGGGGGGRVVAIVAFRCGR